MRYQFIEDYRDQYPISQMCEVMQVSSSGYYHWRKRPISKRNQANKQLVVQIKAIHQASSCHYGNPRIYAELNDQGVRCDRHRVARLMRRHRIKGQHRQTKRPVTTDRNPTDPIYPNRLDRQFKRLNLTKNGWLI